MNNHQKTASDFYYIVQSFLGHASASHEEEERARETSAQTVNSAGVFVWTQGRKVIFRTDAKGSITDFGAKVGKDDWPPSVARKEWLHATRLYPDALGMDCDRPTYVPRCKNVFFQGWFGSGAPKKGTERARLNTFDLHRVKCAAAAIGKHEREVAKHKQEPKRNKHAPGGGTRHHGAKAANGRPAVIEVKYLVGVTALNAYAASDEAGRNTAIDIDTDSRTHMNERELIQRFLQNANPTASGDGLCAVSDIRR